MGRRIELDVSGLEPPEPLERALDALDVLEPGDTLCLLHHREPFPLYGMLRERGFTYTARPGTRTAFEIIIRHDEGHDESFDLL